MACSAARHFALSAATNQLIRTLKIGRGPKGLRPPFFQVVKTPGYFDCKSARSTMWGNPGSNVPLEAQLRIALIKPVVKRSVTSLVRRGRVRIPVAVARPRSSVAEHRKPERAVQPRLFPGLPLLLTRNAARLLNKCATACIDSSDCPQVGLFDTDLGES